MQSERTQAVERAQAQNEARLREPLPKKRRPAGSSTDGLSLERLTLVVGAIFMLVNVTLLAYWLPRHESHQHALDEAQARPSRPAGESGSSEASLGARDTTDPAMPRIIRGT